MPSDSNTTGPHPIDGAYRAALIMTGDAAAAASLVEAALSRLRSQAVSGTTGVPSELDVVRVMWRLRREAMQTHAPTPGGKGVFAAQREASAMARARSKIIAVLDRVDPNVLSILYLVEVRRLPIDSVAEITGLPPVEIMTALKDGFTMIHDAVFRRPEDSEPSTIIDDLPDSWLSETLAYIFDHLDSAPEALRRSVSDSVPTAVSTAEAPSITGPVLPSESSRTAQPTIRFRAVVISVILILSIGFGARFLYDRFTTTLPERNAIALAVRHANRFIPDLETDSPERAHRYLLTHLGEDVPLPEINDAFLTGTAVGEIAAGSRVAVLRYQDRLTAEPITIYALTYRFLDAHAEDIQLSTDVRRQIQSESDFDLHSLGRAEVLVWRHRSYVLLAVTRIDARKLRERIQILTESGPSY